MSYLEMKLKQILYWLSRLHMIDCPLTVFARFIIQK
jgi:hypothetical protein